MVSVPVRAKTNLTKPKTEGYSPMTIHDYLKKHRLELWKSWPPKPNLNAVWTPQMFVSREVDGKTENFPHGDKIDIYSNPDRTHFVALNMTQGLFRVVHYDFIPIISDWQPARSNYERQLVVY